MSRQEAVILYQSQSCKKGIRLMQFLLPIWCLIPFCMLVFLLREIFVSATRDPATALAIFMVIVACCTLIALALFLAAAMADNRIVLNEFGIRFPSAFMPALQCRCERPWSDLKSVDVSTQRTDLLISFESGGKANIDIEEMDDADVDKLITFLEIWANQNPSSPLSDGMRQLLNVEELLNFTDVWESEMSRRFHATSYAPLEPGFELCDGRIRILRQMACGGFSAIYLAQRCQDELVVLKEAVLPASVNGAARKKALENFGREAKLLVDVDHPRITHVFDYFVEDDRHYLLLEYKRGEDLRQLVIRAGAQCEERVLDWAEQIADALEYLHGLTPAIIHRDLTPENIVLTKSGALSLIDFGAANHFIGTATGTIVGKQGYISPEQFKGKAEPRSDVFAFASTLYFLLTGLDPEPLSSSNVSEHRHDISQEMVSLIERCTDIDPSLRPDMKDVRMELAAMARRRARVSGYARR